MKKQITLFFAMLAIAMLNGCSGSDDDGDSSGSDLIVGTWRYVGETYNGEFVADNSEDCDAWYYKFSSNNTGKAITKYCGETDEVFPFSWEKAPGSFYYELDDTDDDLNTAFFGVFSDGNKTLTAYDSESDMQELSGEVYQKQ